MSSFESIFISLLVLLNFTIPSYAQVTAISTPIDIPTSTIPLSFRLGNNGVEPSFYKRSLLSGNVLGQVTSTLSSSGVGLLPISTSTSVDICINLSVSVGGLLSINLNLAASLRAAISQRGVSAGQLAILQAHANSKLTALSKTATNQYTCSSLCTIANNCERYTCPTTVTTNALNHATTSSVTCTLFPKQLTSTSDLLVDLISQLALDGCSSQDYNDLCPSNCSSQPTAAPSHRKKRSIVGLCPVGAEACPLKRGSFSAGYQCINTQEELESCGGCETLGEGQNCNFIMGANAGCSSGKCVIFSCRKGYKLQSDGTCA